MDSVAQWPPGPDGRVDARMSAHDCGPAETGPATTATLAESMGTGAAVREWPSALGRQLEQVLPTLGDRQAKTSGRCAA